jgi:hypothetical protein
MAKGATDGSRPMIMVDTQNSMVAYELFASRLGLCYAANTAAVALRAQERFVLHRLHVV